MGSPGTSCPPGCLRQVSRVVPNLGALCLEGHCLGVSPGFCSSSKPSRGPCQGSASSSYRSLPSPRRPGEPGQGKPWSGQGTALTVKGQAWAPGSRCRAGEREHPRYGPILAGTPLQRGARHCPARVRPEAELSLAGRGRGGGLGAPTLGAGAVGKLGPMHHPSSPHRAAGQGWALPPVGQHRSC